MTNLLFPTDFSEASKSAENYAVELARLKDAKIHFLYVESEYEESEEIIPSYERGQDDTEVKVEKIAYTNLKEIVKAHELENHPHVTLVKVGDLTETILKLIDELDIHFVIMGSSGNENFERYNSNATKVIRKAKCSVLTVPKGVEYKKVDKIVYATDLIHKDEQGFKYLVKFAKVYDAEITLLHVNVDGKDVPGKAPLKSIPEITEGIEYNKLDSEVIIASSVIEGFEKYAKENKVDVLAMTTRSNTFLERFIRETQVEKMVLSSTIPVLTFPE